MILQTPCGEFDILNSFADEYKGKTDIELLETLLEQNKKFVDPVLVQILADKGLICKGMFTKDIERKIAELKGEKNYERNKSQKASK